MVSTTLEGPLDWPDATLVSGDAVDVVARLKEESEVPLRSHGSLSMNRALMAAGLVDRVQVTVFPVITGQTGLDPIFQGGADFDLELVENRTLDGHIQELIYRPTLLSSGRCRRTVAEHTTYLVDRHRVAGEVHEPPRGACRGVRRRIATRREGGDDVVRVRAVRARLVAQRGEVGDDLGELIRMLEIDGEEALVAGRPAERLGLAVEARTHTGTPGRWTGRGRNCMPSTV